MNTGDSVDTTLSTVLRIRVILIRKASAVRRSSCPYTPLSSDAIRVKVDNV